MGSGNLTLVVGALSYAGHLNLTAVADRDNCPDMEVFTQGVRGTLDELAQAVGWPRSRRERHPRHPRERQPHPSKGGPMSDLLSHDVLVISQKAKVIEMTDEYRIFDGVGTEIGTIREVEQSTTKKAVRLFSGVDQFLTHKLVVFDSDGQQVLMVERPAKLMKSKIKVSDAQGTERGAILQDNVVGKKHFALVDGRGDRIGSIDGENWMSWDFAMHDSTGAEVGRITKKWAGILKEGYTTADTYILQIEAEVSSDLRLLMFASAAGLDVALKQDDNGRWGFGGVG